MSTICTKACNDADSCAIVRNEFDAFILPHLSMPKRGPKCKLGYHRVFNLILWVLYTGMQWKCLPIPKTPMANRPSTTPLSTSLCQMGR